MIVDTMDYEVAEGGQVLCQEGREADRMFLLMSGTCDVLVGDAKVAQLAHLDVFGEAALFPDATGAFVRTATVSVTAGEVPARLLVLQKSALGALLESGAMGDACVAHLKGVAEARRKNREHFALDEGALAPQRLLSMGKTSDQLGK
jgi:CRP-like cAMP-binding protein